MEISINKVKGHSFLLKIFLILFLLRCTIFVNNSVYNTIFGGSVIVWSIFLFLELYNLKIKKKNSLPLFLCFLSFHVILVLYYEFELFALIKDSLRYIYLLSIFFIGMIASTMNEERKSKVEYIIILILITHILYGLYNVLTGQGLVDLHGNTRLYGLFESAGKFGHLLSFSIMFFSLSMEGKSRKRKIVYLIFVLLSLALLGYNNSLKSIVSLFGALAFYVIAIKRKFYIVPFLLLLPAIYLYLYPEVYSRIESVLSSSYDLTSIYGEKLENSFQWRVLQWFQLINDWWNNYTIFGAGIGQETQLAGYKNSEGVPYIAHSDFVKLLIEVGLFGFSFIILLFVKLWNNSLSLLRGVHKEKIFIIFIYFSISAILGSSLITISLAMFVFYMGNLLALNKKLNQLEYENLTSS